MIAKIKIKDWEEMEEMKEVKVKERYLIHEESVYTFNDRMKNLAGLEFITVINKDRYLEVNGFTIDEWMYEIIEIIEEQPLDNNRTELEADLEYADQELERMTKEIETKNDFIDLLVDFIKWEVR